MSLLGSAPRLAGALVFLAVAHPTWDPALSAQEPFVPGCTLLFDAIKRERPIDSTCGLEGKGSDRSRLQNRAKNNFCAAGPAARVTFFSFRRLQAQVDQLEDFEWGFPTRLPSDRSPLVDIYTTSFGDTIGEGDLVRLVAFLLHADYSNTSGGEAVNCSQGGQDDNDIHVYLAPTAAEDDRCNSINAEISPHFRPAAWEEIVEATIARPMRFTGQLMFDASHTPCRPGTRSSPGRFSSWEIHPIYAIDVCKNKSLSACRVQREADWIPLDQWLALDSDPPT